MGLLPRRASTLWPWLLRHSSGQWEGVPGGSRTHYESSAKMAGLGGMGSLGAEVQVVAKARDGAGWGVSSLRPLPKLLLEVMPITGQHSDGRAVLHGR